MTNVGNVTAISDTLNAGYNRTFAYDDLNRLTTANSGASLWGTAAGNGYTYDAMGNMLALKLGGSRTDTFAYQPGGSGSAGLPLLTAVTENGTVRNMSYDAIGSELNDGRNTFGYGARELLGTDLPSVQSYAYDGFRHRVQSQLPDGNQRASFFDPSNQLLAESVQSVSNPTSIAYDYVWFGDRPVAQMGVTSTQWTFADYLGTPLLQTDVNGAVSWQVEHEPYGGVWSLRGADAHQPLRFPGQISEQFDSTANGLTELSYNNARWYRPGWGRFTQADPFGVISQPRLYGFRHARKIAVMHVGHRALDAAATDLYAYGEDVPSGMVDPSGFESFFPDSAAPMLPVPPSRWLIELAQFHFKLWGNFCGPGWVNGKWQSEISLTPSQIGPGHGRDSTPRDTLDDCCATHDKCYSGCAQRHCAGPGCKNDCDDGPKGLANCSTTIGRDMSTRRPITDFAEFGAGMGLYYTMKTQPVLRSIPGWPW